MRTLQTRLAFLGVEMGDCQGNLDWPPFLDKKTEFLIIWRLTLKTRIEDILLTDDHFRTPVQAFFF